jgi:hypothetical protein
MTRAYYDEAMRANVWFHSRSRPHLFPGLEQIPVEFTYNLRA